MHLNEMICWKLQSKNWMSTFLRMLGEHANQEQQTAYACPPPDKTLSGRRIQVQCHTSCFFGASANLSLRCMAIEVRTPPLYRNGAR
ncbi:hypothetical protein OS493_020797 [Desmophyllum pertusum]|uniref:Uncharacterized protein n=1 Tax=Desmophyllum pertusum TaxID=174260 RepID=A0A9W9YB44_9CNID|nr:hypothetical protein OS493_020797 [Desmophyllum pertusum]